ncbi:MAG: hypothetical protein ACREJU_06735 [Nitrospiraceae bacterium]
MAVLTALSMGCARQVVTLTISADEEAEGASVFVNGQFAGSLTKSAGTGSSFVMELPKGALTIDVKKDGYRSFRDVLVIPSDAKDHHVYVRLEPVTPTPDSERKTLSGQPAPPHSKVPVCPD